MVKLEDQIGSLVDELSQKLCLLTEDPYMREAVAKYAIRELAWQAVEALEVSNYEIADHLDVMTNVIREGR